MRILIFNFEYPPLGGGGGVATAQLAHYLSRHHEVHIITSRPSRSLRSRLGENNNSPAPFKIHRVPVLFRTDIVTASLLSLLAFIPAALWRGYRLTGQYKFDVINAQFVIPSGIPAAIVSFLRSIPFVLSFIGGDVYDPSKGTSPHRFWFLRMLVRLVSRQAQICTAISADTGRRAKLLHGVKNDIIVTHLGIEPSVAPPALRQSFGLPLDAPLFVSIGRLIPRKGFLKLIHLWPQVNHANLAIVGDGPQRNELQTDIQLRQLSGRVFLLGHLSENDKLGLLQAADCYVSASLHEGFGLVFLEAMDAGLPIVAFDIGGHTDFLLPDINAILVKGGDLNQLIIALNNLAANLQLRLRLGKNNQAAVKSYYLDHTTAQFAAVLEQAARHN